jgi:3-oxoisoapionate kinase
MSASIPNGTLIAFYGDDFTGSSAAMEITAFAGLPTVLFLNIPTPQHLAQFSGYRVIGIAGVARSRNPDWMDKNLPPVFELLRSLDAPIAHYKVCSTFDSAPHIGSIGRAIDIGIPIFGGSQWQPVITGDPGMHRYQAFGYLFAMVDGVGYPLHEHPTMARHPVTPMNDANLARHLSKQTARKIGLVDFVAMKEGNAANRLATLMQTGADIILLDVLDRETLVEAGRLVWSHRGERLFGIGSQGFEAALVAYWQSEGLLAIESPALRAAPAQRVACVSGSVSPVTAAQIACATKNGFAPIRIDAVHAVDERAWHRELETAVAHALAAVADSRDPLVYTAAGPDDPAVRALQTAIASAGVSGERVNERIGAGLGFVLGRVLRQARLTRAIISGGDTSGHAASTLGVYALTAVAPLAPGSPLCRAHSDDAALAGLEIALKGGQVGGPDFFCAAKRGTVLRG